MYVEALGILQKLDHSLRTHVMKVGPVAQSTGTYVHQYVCLYSQGELAHVVVRHIKK